MDINIDALNVLRLLSVSNVNMNAQDLELFRLLSQLENENNFNNLLNVQYLNIFDNKYVRKKHRKKTRINPMIEYGRREFKKRFRFSKSEVKMLYDLIDGTTTLEPMVRKLFQSKFNFQ